MEIQNLTDEQLNSMVAEAMGWRNPRPGYPVGHKLYDPSVIYMDGPNGELSRPSRFSTSLDACTTFEATITSKVLQAQYAEEVVQRVNYERDGQHRFIGASDFHRITATPRQRCIAFLRMKGVL